MNKQDNNNLVERVKNTIVQNKIIVKNDKVVVAVSGGPDSMTLLTILNSIKGEIGFEIVVAHVNHGIRKESAEELKYVEKWCKKINVKCYTLEKNVLQEAKEHKMGVEEYARKIRYDFFYNIKDKLEFNKIAIAHNRDDKVETMLLNMIRGCSLKGLCSLQYITNGIIRPMIDITKEEVLSYCNENNINPCIDKTNFDDTYTRNKIRLNLIPLINKEINPNFSDAMIRLSELVEADEDFIDEYAQNIVDDSIIQKNEKFIILNFQKLICQKDAIKTRGVRKLINILLNNVQGIEKKHILDIIKLMQNNITGKKYIIGTKFCFKIQKKNIAIIEKNI